MESNNDPNIEVVLAGGMVDDLAMTYMTQKAMVWAIAAMMSVYAILTWHLQSLFLSSAAMGQIMLGFPISYFLYRVVFQITYFGTLHTLIIFVILGIAADDCFVFNDAWIQSELMVDNADDVVLRMSYTIRRATNAMAITSATTFIAFLATYFSPIMPISSFGVWASTVVLINYLLVITYFPAIVSYHHRYVKKHERSLKMWIIGLFRSKEEKERAETRKESVVILDKPEDVDKDEPLSQLVVVDVNSDEIELPDSDELILARESRKLESFLRDKWSKWMIKGRFFILSGFAVLIVMSIWQMTKLEGQSERIKFFDDDHFMEKMTWWQEEFVEFLHFIIRHDPFSSSCFALNTFTVTLSHYSYTHCSLLFVLCFLCAVWRECR